MHSLVPKNPLLYLNAFKALFLPLSFLELGYKMPFVSAYAMRYSVSICVGTYSMCSVFSLITGIDICFLNDLKKSTVERSSTSISKRPGKSGS